jgi:hypothetical protein
VSENIMSEHNQHERNLMIIGEYKTVTGQGTLGLDQAVNAAIKESFQPYGNPYKVTLPGSESFAQAMVKPGPAKGFDKASEIR